MKSARSSRSIGVTKVFIFVIAIVIVLFFLFIATGRRWPIKGSISAALKSDLTQLKQAIEACREQLGKGQYPPSSNSDPEAVKQFLAKAFPGYHGDLPEKYRTLDPASSLVFWLGGMADQDGKMIGFSADPKNPFDTTTVSRIGPFYDFDRNCLRNDGGLLVYLQPNYKPDSDPFVYFCPDSKGNYHGVWKNCHPCRSSQNGAWINANSYQLFSPGVDGKYGQGVQYPSGKDYDAQRMDDMSNFTNNIKLGDDMPQ